MEAKVAVMPPAGQRTFEALPDRPRYGSISDFAGAALVACRVSNAHCCLALSIWRRLLMQAFCCAVVRALTKLGIAIAANRPMMATTIMISTSVKPDLMFLLICMFCLSICSNAWREQRRKRV